MRIIHEASLHLHNSFITLTYNDEHLPAFNTLIKRDFQLFMKRLRKAHPEKKIRFYHCGEYGDNFGRPHYHAILFNHHFHDQTKIKGKHKDLYTSQSLIKLWSNPETKKSMGHVSIGTVNFETAAYVAAYVQKKINGKLKPEHYKIDKPLDKSTGEYLSHRQQEYATMSRRPGIAGHWFTKHYKDAYPSDFITVKGKKMKPPKYYDRLYEILYPSDMENIKKNRMEAMEKLSHLFTPEALKQKELHFKAKMALYKRNKL